MKFAVSPRREGASIAVRAGATNGRLRLEVEDDGPGFEATRVREGHGIALLKARLAMAFGERATLHLDSRPGRTCIAIDMPASGPPLLEAGRDGPPRDRSRCCARTWWTMNGWRCSG